MMHRRSGLGIIITGYGNYYAAPESWRTRRDQEFDAAFGADPEGMQLTPFQMQQQTTQQELISIPFQQKVPEVISIPFQQKVPEVISVPYQQEQQALKTMTDQIAQQQQAAAMQTMQYAPALTPIPYTASGVMYDPLMPMTFPQPVQPVQYDAQGVPYTPPSPMMLTPSYKMITAPPVAPEKHRAPSAPNGAPQPPPGDLKMLDLTGGGGVAPPTTPPTTPPKTPPVTPPVEESSVGTVALVGGGALLLMLLLRAR